MTNPSRIFPLYESGPKKNKTLCFWKDKQMLCGQQGRWIWVLEVVENSTDHTNPQPLGPFLVLLPAVPHWHAVYSKAWTNMIGMPSILSFFVCLKGFICCSETISVGIFSLWGSGSHLWGLWVKKKPTLQQDPGWREIFCFCCAVMLSRHTHTQCWWDIPATAHVKGQLVRVNTDWPVKL